MMKTTINRYRASVFCLALLLSGALAIDAGAQAAAAQAHVAAAQAAMAPKVQNALRPFDTFKALFDQMCAQPKQLPDVIRVEDRSAPRPRKDWYEAPAQIFDNLYFIGTKGTGVYAVNSPEGIAVIDTNFDYDAQELVLGLLNLGVDPDNLKYIIVTHAHDDRYWGAKSLQDAYPKAKVVMSAADWDVVAKDNSPAKFKPRKDIAATDGQKLKLGDVTITMYVTPGHKPGTLSLIIDGLTNQKSVHSDDQKHIASLWGGTDINIGKQGVQYYPDGQTMMKTYIASVKRFKELSEKAGVDTIISTTLGHGNTLDKIKYWRIMNPDKSDGGASGPGSVLDMSNKLEKEPHSFVNKEAVSRYYTVLQECYEAHLAWRSGS
jgi:glyoxylase-like metal-dependent hydrolase (beta-lactamase superfamily II)